MKFFLLVVNRKMSYQEYNYYGNYDEDSRKFSYSIQDIYKTQRDKDKYRMKIYEKILSKCFKKIKDTAIHEEFFCFFQLPEFLPGHPLYNMTECVQFILNSLHDKGFNARYVDPFMIYVSWVVPKSELRRQDRQKLIENNVYQQQQTRQTYQEQYSRPPTSNFKPIENTSTSQFFYRKFK